MAYIANTDQDRKEMLDFIGVKSFEELLSNIPQNLLLKKHLDIGEPLSEIEIKRLVGTILSKNTDIKSVNSFLGGGVYDHFVPAVVDHIISRPEFLTTYTPYQAEVSQGTLQWIFEYQSLICELTGMDISNAGMYDGASATAEAILMSCRKNKLTKAIVSDTINPLYLNVIKVYTEDAGIELITVPAQEGSTDIDYLSTVIDDKTSCVVIQSPNYYGIIEDCFEIEKLVRKSPKALFITVNDPISLAILNAPSEYNADIVTGEGQALGNKPYYGGPLFGFLACKLDLARNLPGRIVGETVDANGDRAYCLTLQAREQHIRRDKATSNICSNEALCCLAATIYMCLLGKNGLREIAELSMKNSHYLANEINKIEGLSIAYNKPFFKEFAIKTQMSPTELINNLSKNNIFAGIPIEDRSLLLIAVSETKTKQEIDNLVLNLKRSINGKANI